MTYDDFYEALLKNKALRRKGDAVYYTLEDDEVVGRPIKGGRPLIIYEDTFNFFLDDIKGSELTDFEVYKPILTDEEREYLSMALELMEQKAQKILTITKRLCKDEDVEYIKIRYLDFDGLIDEWYFPPYGKMYRKMYKGMELNKDYTLEELGL